MTKSRSLRKNGTCPPGFHKRASYRSSTGKYVRSRCVRSQSPYRESRKEFSARLSRRMSRRLGSKNSSGCPKGYTLRKGYVRKFATAVREKGYTRVRKGKKIVVHPTSKKTYVEPGCIKDRGLSGKIEPGTGIGPLRSGELLKHGYQYRLPSEARHTALKKAVKEYGALSTFRKLNAVAKLGVRTMPQAAKVFATDRDWIRSHYSLKAF